MSRERLAYAACAWTLAFAAIGFYWAAGGTALLDTIGGEIERRTRARDPDFIAVGWAANGLEVIAAVLVLALVRPFGERLPRRRIADSSPSAASFSSWRAGEVAVSGPGLGRSLDSHLGPTSRGSSDNRRPRPQAVEYGRHRAQRAADPHRLALEP